MIFLRSLLFNISFYGLTALIGIFCMPAIFMPSSVSRKLGIFWGWYTNKVLRIAGISHIITGDLHADKQVIYAAKHQSAWETMSLCWRLDAPVIILKKELISIPVIGALMKRAGSIAVDRSAGMKALRQLRSDALLRKQTGRSFLIFPQGTRVFSGQKADYQIGVYALYEATGLPVVPLALNSGRFWGPRAFSKTPGQIEVAALPMIETGLPRKEFMARLENAIETEMERLER